MFWKNFQIKVKNEKLLILYLNGLFIIFNLKVLALKIEKIESILKPKTDFEEERPNNLVQDDHNQINLIINEKNELIYENDSIRIHLKEGNILNEPSDILVAPANFDLKLIGK